MIGQPEVSEPIFRVRFGGCSDAGLVRAQNEDSYLTTPPYFVVADGMGGHSRGGAASQTVVEAFTPEPGCQWATSDQVVEWVASASAAVAALPGEGRAPGSTLAGTGLSVQLGRPCWLVFNVGDSRVYLLRDGHLSQITVDHCGHQPAPDGSLRKVLTRAMGAGLVKPSAVDQWLIPARPKDVVLICSDGLYSELTDQLIAAVLLDEDEPRAQTTRLVEAAKKAGGRDNVTAVVIVADEVMAAGGGNLDLDETLDGEDDTVPEEDI